MVEPFFKPLILANLLSGSSEHHGSWWSVDVRFGRPLGCFPGSVGESCTFQPWLDVIRIEATLVDVKPSRPGTERATSELKAYV